MKFNVRVVIFNSRGILLVEVGFFFGERIEKFVCHRETGAREYPNIFGRGKGIEKRRKGRAH